MTENTTTPPTGLTSYHHRFQPWKRVSLRETPLTNQGLHNHCGILHPSTISRQLYHIMVITNFHPRGISPTCQRVIIIHVHDHFFRKQTSQLHNAFQLCLNVAVVSLKGYHFGEHWPPKIPLITQLHNTWHCYEQNSINQPTDEIFSHPIKKQYSLFH